MAVSILSVGVSYWPLAILLVGSNNSINEENHFLQQVKEQPKMRDFTKYDIWIDSIEISVEVYRLTKKFPEDEKFGLTSQIRRASISISSNFAEGCSRTSEKDFKRFVEISLGSAFEVKTQLIISSKLGFVDTGKVEELIENIDKVSKQLNALRNKLK